MAHTVTHHGLTSQGSRRSKHQHNRDFQSLMGLDPHRRSGTRPQIRSQFSSGLAMGAYRGVSVSSAHSDYPAQTTVNCNFQLCLRVVSILAVVTGTLMLACGLFVKPGTLILGLCIPGALMIVAVLLVWCMMYVWHGRYCTKSSEGGSRAEGATHRPARGGDEEATVDLHFSRSAPADLMSSYGPNTGIDRHHPMNAPPSYSPMDTCGSFPISERSMEQPPSTPPPPYNEVT